MAFDRHPTASVLGPLTEIEEKRAHETLWTSGDLGLLRNGPRISVVGSPVVSTLGLAQTA